MNATSGEATSGPLARRLGWAAGTPNLSWVPLSGVIAISLLLIGQSLYDILRFYDVFPMGDMVDVVWRYVVGPVRDFWIFHDNEHLPLAVMPLYWIDFRVFDAQGLFLILCMVALAVAIALGPVAALSRTLPRQRLLVATIACCSVAMQLWLGGYVNLLWTKQVHMYVALFAVVMAIACAVSARPMALRRLAACCAWATVATFSFGYGITAFPVLFVVGLWRRWPWRWLGLIVLAATASLLLYLALSAAVISTHGRIFFAYQNTRSQALYTLTFLASPVFNALLPLLPKWTALGAAYAVTGAGTAWMGARIWARRGAPPSELMTWAVALALFSLLTAVQTALARSFFGFEQAADSRYIVGQMPFWLGLLLVGADHWSERRPIAQTILATIMLAGVMLLLLSQQYFGLAIHARNYDRYSSAMSAIDGVHDMDVDTRDNFYHLDRVPIMFAGLRARGWSAFAWPQARWVGRSVASFGEARTGCVGAFDTLTPVGRGSGFRADGWATDRATAARSAWVLLADGAGVVRGVAHGGGPRGDVTDSLHAPAELYAGWTGYVPSAVDRAGLSAWLLMKGKHPCRLPPLPPPPK